MVEHLNQTTEQLFHPDEQERFLIDNYQPIIKVLGGLLDRDPSLDIEIEYQRSLISDYEKSIANNQSKITPEELDNLKKELINFTFNKLEERIKTFIQKYPQESEIRSKFENIWYDLKHLYLSLYHPENLLAEAKLSESSQSRESIFKSSLNQLKLLPSFLEEIQEYDNFFHILDEDKVKNEAYESDKTETDSPELKQDESVEVREVIKADELFEPIKQGLKPQPESTVRQVRFGETEEPFTIGGIESENQKIFKELFIRNHWNLREDGLLEKVVADFQTVEIEDINQSSPRRAEEADITLPVSVQAETDYLDLPVPLNYQISAIEPGIQIERSKLGTYRIKNLSSEHTEIRYRIEPTEKKEETLSDLTEFQKGYRPKYVHPITETVDSIISQVKDSRKKVELIAGAVMALNPVYSTDSFIGEVYQATGQDRYLAYEALQIGHCDSLSVHVANRLRQHQIPSLVACGLVLDEQSQSFEGHQGHAKVHYFDELRQSHLLEATALTTPYKLDLDRVTEEEKTQLLLEISHLPSKELFNRLDEFARNVKVKIDYSELRRFQDSMPFVNWDEVGVNQGQFSGEEDFQRVIDFQKRWDALKEEGELDLQLVQEFLQNYHQIRYSGLSYRLGEWFDLTFSDSPELKEKYKKDYLKRNYQNEILTEAKALLSSPKTNEDAKNEFKKFIFDNSFNWPGQTMFNDKLISPRDAFEILSLEEIVEMSQGDDNVMMALYSGLYDLTAVDDRSPDEVWAQTHDRLDKMVGLSEKLLTESKISENKFPIYFHLGEPNDLIEKVSYIFKETENERYQKSICQVIANLIEASENPEEEFFKLYFSFNTSNPHPPEALGLIFKKLGDFQVLPERLNEQGHLTPETKTGLITWLETKWLPNNFDQFSLENGHLNYLLHTGVNPEEIFNPQSINRWLLPLIKEARPELNIPWKNNGQFDEQFSASLIVSQAKNDHYSKVPQGSIMLQNLKTLNNWTFGGIKLESPFTDEVRETWGIHSESDLYQHYLEHGKPKWNIGMDEFEFLNVGISESLNFKAPFEIPEKIREEFWKKSEYLKLLSESVINLEKTDIDSAWQEIFNQNPEMIPIVEEILRSEEKKLTKQLYREIANQLFTPTEKYLARLGLTTFFSGQPPRNFNGTIELLKKFTETIQEIPKEVRQDEQQLDLILKQLEKEFFSQVGDSQAASVFWQQLPLQKKFQSLIFIGDLVHQPEIQEESFQSQLDSSLSGYNIDYFTTYSLYNSQIVDSDISIVAKRWAMAIDGYSLKVPDYSDWLKEIRQGSVDSINDRPPTVTFGEFASDFFIQHTQSPSSEGEYYKTREYHPGDDVRMINPYKSAKYQELYVDVENDLKINPIECLVDAEWLASGASSEKNLPNNLANLFRIFYLALNERIPISCTIQFRGEKLLHFSSDKIKEDLFNPKAIRSIFQAQQTDHLALAKLWKIANGVESILKIEKKYGVNYPASSIVRAESFGQLIPDQPKNYFTFIADNNLSASMPVINVLAEEGSRSGFHVQMAKLH